MSEVAAPSRSATNRILARSSHVSAAEEPPSQGPEAARPDPERGSQVLEETPEEYCSVWAKDVCGQ